jgi:hypothetical protein
MRSKSFFLYIPFLFFIFYFLFPTAAGAVCPVCTVAVVGGIELSRWLGIDDSVTGLWVGGLTVSLILWTLDWFGRKNINFRYQKIITVIGYLVLIILPLYFLNIINFSFITISSFCGCGLNKMLVGIIAGMIFFYLGAAWYEYLKKKNNGHAHFPFQKVVMPILPLLILSFVFYFLTK